MAMMKKGALEIPTPELALKPHTLPRPAQITVADEEEETVTKREALSDADIITTPSALSEPDSITPLASVNMLELLKRVARPTGDVVDVVPRPPQHTLPLVHDAPDRTLPLPNDAKPIDRTMVIPKEEQRKVVEAIEKSKNAAPLPVAAQPSPPKPRRRWPFVLLLLLLI